MTNKELKELLDVQVERFNRPDFIAEDPISIPHSYASRQNIEISGLIAAVFSWGNRKTIINKSREFLSLMGNDPYDFLLSHRDNDLKPFLGFRHRTFQPTDALYFLDFLSRYYRLNDSMEPLFSHGHCVEQGLIHFHQEFFQAPHAPERTKKHIPTPLRKSTCKRLNMFLRWMVRRDENGVDFGLWNGLSMAHLICPIDVHAGTVARELGLLKRKQNDWLAAIELTKNLRQLDAYDPVQYDFALFGIGVIGGMADILDR